MLDAHEIGGEARFLERAEALARAVIARFAAEDGGFYDRIPEDQSLGRLNVLDRPIVDNGLFAEALLRLASLTGEESWRENAERTLALFAKTYAAAASFAAPYARALRRYLSPDVAVRIVGEAATTDEFREAALRLPAPFVAIRTSPTAAALGLPEEPRPAAYVCQGTICGSPAAGAAGIRAAYDDLSTVKHRA
ncbi:MAG TPA: hypothetical protein VKB39_12040 [Candidatus Baltobacteraceae bacterium]|nr:hypothetical protein [Candidatus Baltobacteraceae bacterium]